eukprot:gene1207-17201_t
MAQVFLSETASKRIDSVKKHNSDTVQQMPMIGKFDEILQGAAIITEDEAINDSPVLSTAALAAGAGAFIVSGKSNPFNDDVIAEPSEADLATLAELRGVFQRVSSGLWARHGKIMDDTDGAISMFANDNKGDFTLHLNGEGQEFFAAPLGRRVGDRWVTGSAGRLPQSIEAFYIDNLFMAFQNPSLDAFCVPVRDMMVASKTIQRGDTVTKQLLTTFVQSRACGTLHTLPAGISGDLGQNIKYSPAGRAGRLLLCTALDWDLSYVDDSGSTSELRVRPTEEEPSTEESSDGPSVIFYGRNTAMPRSAMMVIGALQFNMSILEFHLESFGQFKVEGGVPTSDRKEALAILRERMNPTTPRQQANLFASNQPSGATQNALALIVFGHGEIKSKTFVLPKTVAYGGMSISLDDDSMYAKLFRHGAVHGLYNLIRVQHGVYERPTNPRCEAMMTAWAGRLWMFPVPPYESDNFGQWLRETVRKCQTTREKEIKEKKDDPPRVWGSRGGARPSRDGDRDRRRTPPRSPAGRRAKQARTEKVKMKVKCLGCGLDNVLGGVKDCTNCTPEQKEKGRQLLR